jgi:hypothetical protein
MEISNDKVDLVLGAQYDANIDPGKSIECPLALAVARQWIKGHISLYEMRVAYRNLAAILPEICFSSK